tara:strand:- start:123 stop:1037 length:915 start_codon:yes stop_codon:yes gene_type:complete
MSVIEKTKSKACIVYISSRTECLKHSLQSVWENYNYKHNYPVYVHYFDDIYDNAEIQNRLCKKNEQDITFVSVPYETPPHLKEEDLFYNRTCLWYVRTSFSIRRKGYLHMCHFTSNMYGYENTELEKYEYIMTHDDEAGFNKEIPYDPVQIMDERPELMGALSLRGNTPHQGHYDTSVNLWNFMKGYIKHFNVIPRNEEIRNLLEDPEGGKKYLALRWPDTYVIKTEMFETESWKNWINAINVYGGNYKYRWGDCLIFGLYYYLHHGTPYDFSTEGNPVSTGYYNQGKFRMLQDIAPNVKDPQK